MSGFDNLFGGALANARASAYHLEQRDTYALADRHRPSFESYDGGPVADASFMDAWGATVREAGAHGVAFRRLRIVSEPVSDYIRWEHALTPANIAAGEEVRWLSRRSCLDLLVVPVDFWVFDGDTVLFNHFAGDGSWPEPSAELCTEPGIVKMVADCFDAAWSRAIPHDQYTV